MMLITFGRSQKGIAVVILTIDVSVLDGVVRERVLGNFWDNYYWRGNNL